MRNGRNLNTDPFRILEGVTLYDDPAAAIRASRLERARAARRARRARWFRWALIAAALAGAMYLGRVTR